MIDFLSEIDPDTWILGIFSLLGSFLAGFFAVIVMKRQLKHDRKFKESASIESLIKYYFSTKSDFEETIFELKVMNKIISSNNYTLETTATLQASTIKVDNFLSSVKDQLSDNIPTFDYGKFFHLFRLIDSINGYVKEFYINQKDPILIAEFVNKFIYELEKEFNCISKNIENIKLKL